MALETRSCNDFLINNFDVEYHPSEEPADITSTVYIRQNPWKKQQSKRTCLFTGYLSLPHAHNKLAVDNFQENGVIPEGQPTKVANIPTGTIVYVPDNRRGVLVRITSEVKAGILPWLAIARKERTCGHNFTCSSKECEDCENSVVSVFDTGYSDMLNQGYIIEPFYSLYRECEAVAFTKIPEGDLHQFATVNSVGKITNHWRRVELPLPEE